MWLRVSAADSAMTGFRTIEAEGQTRHIVPITEWTADPAIDTYHQLHHHGVAIESDLMAYRIYFDKKQTIDIYAKRRHASNSLPPTGTRPMSNSHNTTETTSSV